MQKELLRNVHHFCPEFTELPWSRLATKTFWVPNVCQEPDSITSSWPHFYCYCSVTKSCLTLCNPWTAAHQDSLSFTTSWSLLKFMSIESVMLSNHLILCRLHLLLPSIFPIITIFKKGYLRSMEQNRKPRDKSTHRWTPYLWQRRQEYTME